MKSLRAWGLSWSSSTLDGAPKSAAGILPHGEESKLNDIWIDITKSEEAFRRLHSESQKYQHAVRDIQETEEKFIKHLGSSNIGSFSPMLSQIGDEYLSVIVEMKDNSKQTSRNIQDLIGDGPKLYHNMYEHLNNFKKKRDQCVTDCQKSQEKFDKLKLKGKRTTDLMVEKEKRLRNLKELNSKFISGGQQCHDARIPFLQICLQALVQTQIDYYGTAASEYSKHIQQSRKGHAIKEAQYTMMMNDHFAKIKQLEIVES